MGARARYVEDKSSGIGLVQDLNRERGRSYIIGVPRNSDKVSRAFGAVPHIAQGKVLIPSQAHWLPEYVQEFTRFSPLGTHAHDDQIDPTMDAIEIMLIQPPKARGYGGIV
jgi:predicted phage terminase large subunit-like protein